MYYLRQCASGYLGSHLLEILVSAANLPRTWARGLRLFLPKSEPLWPFPLTDDMIGNNQHGVGYF